MYINLLIPWWSHQMETFSALLALCDRISPFIGELPSQSQWRGALMFSLNCAGTNSWVNNRDGGDLKRHRAHYDVTIIKLLWNTRSQDSRSRKTQTFPCKPLNCMVAMVRILLTVINKRHVFDNPNLHCRNGFITENSWLLEYSPGSCLLNWVTVRFILLQTK